MTITRSWLFLCFVVVLINNVYKTQAQYYDEEEPDVECTTPNGESAQCISIRDCAVLRSVLSNRIPEVERFLRASQCQHPQSSRRNPYVCCGSTASYNTGGGNTRLGAVDANVLPTGDDCGYQKAADRILGGNRTTLEEFPWTAILQYRKNNGNGFAFSCGGTIISSRYILTAAHCVKGNIISAVGRLAIVRLGEWDLDNDEDCFETKTKHGQAFRECSDAVIDAEYEDIIVHEDYQDQPTRKQHDIALIRLKDPLPFTDYVRPICLPSPSSNPSAGSELSVAGWGRTESARYSPIKLKLIVPVTTQERCTSRFSPARIQIYPTHICAGGKRGEDSCQGDSGGPLMRKDPRNNQWFIEGVVSFGGKCGTAGLPGVYTRIANYVDWIRQNVRS